MALLMPAAVGSGQLSLLQRPRGWRVEEGAAPSLKRLQGVHSTVDVDSGCRGFHRAPVKATRLLRRTLPAGMHTRPAQQAQAPTRLVKTRRPSLGSAGPGVRAGAGAGGRLLLPGCPASSSASIAAGAVMRGGGPAACCSCRAPKLRLASEGVALMVPGDEGTEEARLDATCSAKEGGGGGGEPQ